MALSKQSPADPVEVTTPISRHRLPKASEVYCEPLSLWWTTPCAWRCPSAMFSAASTSSVRRWSAMDHPTTLRLNTSSTMAKYKGNYQDNLTRPG